MAGKAPASSPVRPLGDVNVSRLLMQRYRRRNLLVGLGLLMGVASIYSYTILAVKQENFLDEEFDEQVKDARTSHGS